MSWRRLARTFGPGCRSSSCTPTRPPPRSGPRRSTAPPSAGNSCATCGCSPSSPAGWTRTSSAAWRSGCTGRRPSTALYRWDDRALISFLSLGRHTSQGSQLEIDVDTSLGHFVEQHFDELWGSATTLDGYLRLHLTLTGDPDDGPRDFHLPYVQVDGLHYLADPQVLAHLARVHAGNGTVLATLAGQPDTQFQLRVVDDADEPLREVLTGHFLEKYGWPGRAFLFLVAGQETRRTRFRRLR